MITASATTDYVNPNSNWFCGRQLNVKSSAQFLSSALLPDGRKIEVVCDGKTDGGDWLLLSRRLSDNSTQFHGHTEPSPGWGNISGDFWLGTDVFHQLTSGSDKMELLIDMRLCDNNRVYRRKYQNFSVGDQKSTFELRLDMDPDEDSQEGLSGSNHNPMTCSYEIGRQHAVSCWWWSNRPAVSINAEAGCDIPPPLNNFWFTRKPQRRFQIRTVEMKIRPMRAAVSGGRTKKKNDKPLCLIVFLLF